MRFFCALFPTFLLKFASYIIKEKQLRYISKYKTISAYVTQILNQLKLYNMSNVSIFEKKWLDIVFEGKNKEYGAYQLRRESTKTNLLAFFIGISSIALMAFGLSAFGKTPEPNEVIRGIPLLPPAETVTQPEKKEPEKKEPKKTTKPEGNAVKKFTQNASLVVTPSSEAKPDVPENVDRNGGSNNPNDGEGKPGAGAGLQPEDGNGQGEGGGNNPNPNEIFGSLNVEEQPSFPGGMKKFGEYIITNFSADVEDTQYKVTLQFVVEPNGTLSNIIIAKSSGDNSIDTEAIRVLKSLKTKWNPGKMGETAVRTQFQQTIVIGNN